MEEDLSGVISLDAVVLAGVEEIVLAQHHLEGQLGDRDGVGTVRKETLLTVVNTVAGSKDEPEHQMTVSQGPGSM